jgi:prepilin-type N-terminal cleavage/methylation domain-containing protein
VNGPRADLEAGFTLAELLVGIVVLGILSVALGTALFIGLKTSGDTQTSLDRSNLELLLSNYLAADVQTACNPAAVQPTCNNHSPNPSTTASASCSTSGSFAMDTLSSAAPPAAGTWAYDTTITYSLTSGKLTRVVTGPKPSTTTIAENVQCFDATYASSGNCKDQFQVDVTATNSSRAIDSQPYSFSVCAHRRAG